MLLCLKTRMEAPESRAPKIMELWFNSSLMIKQPFRTSEGMVVEFVAKPMDTTIAAGFPTNCATLLSS